MRFFLFSLLFVCLSCKSQKKSSISNEEPLPLGKPTLVLKDSYSNIDSAQVQIINEMKILNRFLMEVNKTRKPGISVPDIDFSKDMLILVCAGEQLGDYEPSLSILEKGDRELIIEIEEKKGSDSTKMAISTPFYLYKIAKSEKQITVIKE